MSNIKKKSLKFIILITYFVGLMTFTACEHVQDSPHLKKMKKMMGKNVVDVAIFLPMHGSSSAMSKEYAKMIKMGLSDSAKTRIKVTTYDSANLQNLAASLDHIIDENIDIIIGPIYSDATKIVLDKTKDTNIIVMSLSNNPVFADDRFFVFGHAPMRQLEKITNYFLDHEYKNYILLLPSSKYSTDVSKILHEMIANHKATLSRVEFYGNAPSGIKRSVKVISDHVDYLNENDLNLTQPVLIVGDELYNLNILYKNLTKYNIDKKSLVIGDSRIDTNFSSPLNITFTGSLNITDTNIAMRALDTGIKHISFMHAISYDAGKMLGDYIGNSFNKTQLLKKLQSRSVFIGISGTIYFVDSIAQRDYDIVRKENGKYQAIESM